METPAVYNTVQLATGEMHVQQSQETASTAVAAQARAMVEARYVMAIKRPRDLDTVREKLLKECRRPGFAEVARYKKPIGKGIEGPSIRFAEAAIRCMTNIEPSVITVYDDHEKRIVRVTLCDLEANIPYSQDVTINKTVERSTSKPGDTVLKTRTNSKGYIVYVLEATDDDILNKQNALISKAIRTLGLRLVPGDIIEECMDAVIDTQRNRDAQDPDAAKRRLFDAFVTIGVKATDIKEWLGHEGETLAPKELADLRAIYSAIKDGEATWRDVIELAREGREQKADTTAATKKPGKGLNGLAAAVKAKAQETQPEQTETNLQLGTESAA